MEDPTKVWGLLTPGGSLAVVGVSELPSAPEGWREVRVRCGGPPRALGPLVRARDQVDRLVGSRELVDRAAARLRSGLRRRLLQDAPEHSPGAGLITALDRLADATEERAVLIFEAVDRADPASLALLRRAVERPSLLRPSLLLGFETEPSFGPARDLLAAVRRVGGDDRVLAVDPAGPADAPDPLQIGLSPGALRVARAAALAGPGFEVELVARLLGQPPLRVLEALQEALDAGLELTDLGEGRFHLGDEATGRLRGSLTPSLSTAWNRALAEILSGGAVAEAPLEVPSLAPADSPAPAPLADEDGLGEDEFSGDIFEEEAEEAPRIAAPELVTEEIPLEVPGRRRLGREAPPWGGEPLDDDTPDLELEAPWSRPPPRRVEGNPSLSIAPDPGRAAGFLAAAGEAERAALRYLDAARRSGPDALPVAVAHVEEALALLEELPDSDARRLIRGQAHAELGRLMWAGAGEGFTLRGALEQLERAARLLGDDAPPALRADLRALTAWVCFDMGDRASLERALEELTAASREFSAAGRPRAAARLLNDQAEVWVRLGDPVRAVHLLRESRALFSGLGDDPEVLVELAETDHLLARLPLHVEARPGQDLDAMTAAAEHAANAALIYERLGLGRERARVLSTIGRLEFERGHLEQARARLSEAFRAQRMSGDLLGLARTAAALARVLSAGHLHREALELLRISVELNHAKGSPLGLAYNREALELIAREAEEDGAGGRELAEELAAVERELSFAEQRWGRAEAHP